MEAIEKIHQGRKHDKELRVLQERRRRNQFTGVMQSGLMPFKAIVRNRLRLKKEAKLPTQPHRKKTLQEILDQPDDNGGMVTSIFAAIPVDAADREQSLAMVINELKKMADNMNVAVTVVGFDDDQPGT
jgi:hypothetical protein